MCYVNARSVKNKTVFLNDYISTHNYDLFAISETWLNCEATNDTYINALLPPGYAIYHVDREHEERGGGVALIHKQCIDVTKHRTIRLTQFEYLKCTVQLNKLNIDLIVFYRPPPSIQNKCTTTQFFEEWSDFICHQTILKSELIIVGDANFHLENYNEHNTRRFLQSLESHGLQQHVNGPTHHRGHTLDVLISRDTSTLLSDTEVNDIHLCSDDGNLVQDHYAIHCTIRTPAPFPNRQSVSYRKYTHIDIGAFRHDIASTSSLNNIDGTADQLAQRYITGLSSLINIHAPLIHRVVTIRPHSPWYTEPLRDAKRLRRQLERKWRRHNRDIDLRAYRVQCAVVVKHIHKAKTEYYSSRITECKNDQKTLFNITNKLLENHHSPKLPSDDTELSNRFNSFFYDKISNLRANFVNSVAADTADTLLTNAKFRKLRPTTNDEVSRVIMSCTNKSCELDPLPTWLLKKCLDELLPLLTSLFNTSLETGQFPQQFKSAIIRPLLKKPSLDTNELMNYRPVSNLHFISKILEKLVVKRLEEHMSIYNLYDNMQSAYKAEHSTETALMKINNDILSSLDRGKCTVLASLDLSAAFDTVDHSIFIGRLQRLYGVSDIALQWFTSYLQNRDSRVCIDGSFSTVSRVISGVPQGSVLGARLYTMYTRPLSDIVKQHGVMYHSYADDTQVYLECDYSESALKNAILKLSLCIVDICAWMSDNALKLNTEKTELIVFRLKDKQLLNEQSINVGCNVVKESAHVKILGVTLDQHMSFEKHITNTCRTANMHIRKINSIRNYLSEDAVRTLVQAVVIVRLDYCNSLLIGLPLKHVKRLQLTQNTAARVISRTSRYSHITATLRTLHWLPISKRCQYKILVFTFKALHNTAPTYLCDILNWYEPSRTLRSASTTSLIPNRNRTIRLGRRLFDTSSATLWNTLPNNIKSADNMIHFKKLLKTFLFNL